MIVLRKNRVHQLGTEVWEFFMDVQEAVDLVAPFGKAKAQEAAEAQGLAL